MGSYFLNAQGKPQPTQQRLNADGTIRRVPVLVMTSGVGAVTPDGDTPGWVSGAVAGLAASASIAVTFYLGPAWDQYTSATAFLNPGAPATGFKTVSFRGHDAAIQPGSPRFLPIMSNTGNGIAYADPLTGIAAMTVRVSGPYLTVFLGNNDAVNAQGASAFVSLTVYP